MLEGIERYSDEDFAYHKAVEEKNLDALFQAVAVRQFVRERKIEVTVSYANQFEAYVEGSIDVCGDPECGCRNKVVIGRGATYDEAVLELMEMMRD